MEGTMNLAKFIEMFLSEDTPICVCSEKNMNILYSGAAGDCYFGLAKTVNFCRLYPYLVDGDEIGIIVTLTPEYCEWRSKVNPEGKYDRLKDSI